MRDLICDVIYTVREAPSAIDVTISALFLASFRFRKLL